MFSRVLVANRGEVAVRVIRALHELGVEAVAVYSTADAGALYTRLADRKVCIGPPPATESYLNIPSIIAAGKTTGCEAVHPGWGFLAENPDFVHACAANDLVFVWPDADVMTRMGDKVEAKRELAEAGVPLVPGTEAVGVEDARVAAAEVGYPVLLKASAGGGGKGMKLIEESPSPTIDEATREAMEADVARSCRAIGYLNAGTFEFLLAPDGSYHFIELNARLQVEHPVSELVTGVDIVREQLRIAAGEQLRVTGRAPRRGHAIEVRLNAEDPARGFAPAPGVIERFRPPLGPGIRLDTHVEEGSVIPPYYDSLIGKLVVWDEARPAAIERCLRALSELELRGVPTTRELGIEILDSDEFRSGRYSTNFLEETPLFAVRVA